MLEQALTVSRRQCDVVCRGGVATLVSNGRSPTLWRERGGPWCSVSKGESLVLSDGDQVRVSARVRVRVRVRASSSATATRCAWTRRTRLGSGFAFGLAFGLGLGC